MTQTSYPQFAHFNENCNVLARKYLSLVKIIYRLIEVRKDKMMINSIIIITNNKSNNNKNNKHSKKIRARHCRRVIIEWIVRFHGGEIRI